jgi:FkbM family methyltransferase
MKYEYKCINTRNDEFLIEEFFKEKYNGYFIDVGAANGICDSTTYLLEKYYSWTGLLIEANSSFFNELTNNRTSKCINRALSNVNSTVNFIESYNKYYSCIESDLNWWHKNKCLNDGYEIKIKHSINFETLLVENNCPKKIDLISLDIEGGEYKSLSKFPFESYDVEIFIVEMSSNDILDLMKNNGYTRIINPFNKIDYEGYFIKI